jgi:hypothetical protein
MDVLRLMIAAKLFDDAISLLAAGRRRPGPEEDHLIGAAQ